MAKIILTFDGGGILGLLSARVLQRLGVMVPDLMQHVESCAGTSTGGIIALALGSGLDTARIVNLYRSESGRIFGSRGWLDSVSFDESYRANYSAGNLRAVLSEYIGGTLFRDMNRPTLISSFDLFCNVEGLPPHGRPKFWDSTDDDDGRSQAVEVAMRTAAAPTFFPTRSGYADGVLAANNPSDCAIAWRLARGDRLEDLHMISIGSGLRPFNIDADNDGERDLDWGLVQWAPRFLDLFVAGSSFAADYRCRQLLGNRYVRINPPLSRDIDIDSVDRIDEILKAADAVDLDRAKAVINQWL